MLLAGALSGPGQDVSQPGLMADIVEPGGNDQAAHHRRALAAAIRSAEQPGLTPHGHAAQGPFGGVVAQADTAIVEEALDAPLGLSM